MELSQGEMILKPKTQEFSSLFMIHRLYVMHAPIRFYEYISNGLGIMALTRSRTYGQTGGQTDGRTGRTGVTLNALPRFFDYSGAYK